MNAATAGTEKHALAVARNPETPQFFRAVKVLRFERLRRQPEMGGDADVVRSGQVDEPPLVTTIDATALALESLTGYW